jgi:hypothetical protein
MNQYMIYCCAGTGGLFLTTIFAQILGYDVRSSFSNTGNAHDMGHGGWKGANNVCFVGSHWDLNYRSGFQLYYSHVLPDSFVQSYPDTKLIVITTEPRDYRKVTELYVRKAWPDIWTPEEYAKWASPQYPSYSCNNIANSKLIRDDLINDFEITNIKKWHEENELVPSYATINFRTIMGIDDQNLVDVVCNITGGVASAYTKQYASEYQQLNRSLYFKNYV